MAVAALAVAAELVAQLLDLLEDPLELVLGAVQLAGQAGDVGAPGDAQVAQDEIGQVGADPLSAATFSALRASSAPKPGLATSSSNARAVLDSASSYSARTCASGDGVSACLRSAIAPASLSPAVAIVARVIGAAEPTALARFA